MKAAQLDRGAVRGDQRLRSKGHGRSRNYVTKRRRLGRELSNMTGFNGASDMNVVVQTAGR